MDVFSCGLRVIASLLMFFAEGSHFALKLVEKYEGTVLDEILDIVMDNYIHSMLTVQNNDE